MNIGPALIPEPRPRDFHARLRRRRPRRLGARPRRHYGRRALVLLAAVGVPALAAPDPWQTLTVNAAGVAGVTVDPMPFERRGDSFPGSAFYYLASEQSAVALPGAGRSNLADFAGGPVARAMRLGSSALDRSRALECLTAAVYYEAASEPDQGQRAVAQVVLNRVAHPAYPDTVCGVVYQGSERSTGCQFSFTCDGALGRRPSPLFWDRARRVALAALSGHVEPGVGLATHYHTIQISPYWAPSLNFIATIGAHRFYSFKGQAGQPGTFRFAFAGGELVPAPHARSAQADRMREAVLDPLALQRAYASAAPASAAAPAAAAPAPVPDDPATGPTPRATADTTSPIRPDYARSGQWIGHPGT